MESEGKEGKPTSSPSNKATQPQPNQERKQSPAGEKSGTVEEKSKKSEEDEGEAEAKETTFVSPTEEEIKQLCETPKAGEAKKKE